MSMETRNNELPQSAEQFVRFMETVWSDHCVPADDGAMAIYSHPLYDEFHDAIGTACRCGAVRTGGTKVYGEDWHVFRFPADHGRCAIRIQPDGNAVALSNYRYGAKRRGNT